MSVNPAVAFTLILLSLMFAASLVSASWGYALGTKALTGVRQPDTRPATGALNKDINSPPHREDVLILPEAEIIKNVKARMDGSISEPERSDAQSANPASVPGTPAGPTVAAQQTSGEDTSQTRI